jgi:DNA (cytosine-5)-methyltransferase 1
LTATAGNPSAASVTHPFECRKFSILEVKRLSGFPDDYKLQGTYAQQFERCGRSVTPPVTKAIAETIRAHILK